MVAVAKLSGLLELTMDDDSKDLHEFACHCEWLRAHASEIMSVWGRSEAFKTKLAKASFQRAVSGLENLIGDVQKKIHKHASFLNDITHYCSTWTDPWPHTDDLADLVQLGFQASMRAEWIKMASNCPRSPSPQRSLIATMSGVRCVCVCVCVRVCVQQMAGKVQVSEAEKIIKKKDALAVLEPWPEGDC